eukprot:7177175-Prymnesium_polylepis.1
MFSHNFVAFSTRATDSTTNHVDIQNDDSFFEYNIGYRNEVGAAPSSPAMRLQSRSYLRACAAGWLL